MSCPSCGAQLEVPNQQFCHECGGKLPDSSKSSEFTQGPSISPENRNFHQIPQKSVKVPVSRPLSKRSLGFGIVSFVIALTTFNLGSGLIIEPIIFNYISRQNVFIALGVANSVGIVFGTVSTFFNKQAKNSEAINGAMKAGSTLGILGLTFNIFLTITAFSIVFISVV